MNKEIKVFDSHTHYYGDRYDELLEYYLIKNKNLSVAQIGYNKKTNKLVMEQAKKYENVYCAIGVHPNDAHNIDFKYINELENNIDNCNALKSGLDLHYGLENIEAQLKWFNQIIDLANKYKKPLVIHSRDAQELTLKLVKIIENTFVMHCYSYSSNIAKKIVSSGGVISIAGVVTYKNAKQLHDVVSKINLRNMMIETDCPYLSPVPYRGKTNFPHYVIETAKKIAEIKKVDLNDVCEITTKNAKDFYEIS